MKHKLVVVGDSISQGFMSGAIHRTDISYPMMVADALGVRDHFIFPDFHGEGGLPVNLEMLLRSLSKSYGREINWWEWVFAANSIRSFRDSVEDYWERGRGAMPMPNAPMPHNLAVWGFEVRDGYTVTEGTCRRAIPDASDDWVSQTPEWPMYRTARRVLNPTFGARSVEWHQMRCAQEFGNDGGIENLVVALGANNALGTVASLNIDESSDEDLNRLPHDRKCNLYLPEHFDRLYDELAREIEKVRTERVFLATVPKVTIPPVSRGVSPNGSMQGGYYEYYARPWIWDSDFDPKKHSKLTRNDAIKIDDFIDTYNEAIKSIAASKDWHVFDMAGVLDQLAFRRQSGEPGYSFPQGLSAALKKSERLDYLVDSNGKVNLDTRFISTQDENPKRLSQGGLFSLDGIHPTTVGYGILSHHLLEAMEVAGVPGASPSRLNWDAIVAADTLLHDPPEMLAQLRTLMGFLDRHGLLSAIIGEFQ